VNASETNGAVVLEYVAAFNAGDWDGLRRVFTTDAVIHGVLGSGGIENAISIWQELHSAFGVRLSVEGLIVEGDRAAARYIEQGTFVGPFRGTPPTGKSYSLVAMEWFILRNGRIAERWGARDSAALMRQVAAEP
jgi:steroid delta-isomerase-like uncharacterized protein